MLVSDDILSIFEEEDPTGSGCISEIDWSAGNMVEVMRFLLEILVYNVSNQKRQCVYFKDQTIELPDFVFATSKRFLTIFG